MKEFSEHPCTVFLIHPVQVEKLFSNYLHRPVHPIYLEGIRRYVHYPAHPKDLAELSEVTYTALYIR